MIMRCIGLALLTGACTSGTPEREAAALAVEPAGSGQASLQQAVDTTAPAQVEPSAGATPKRDLVGMSASWAMIDEAKVAQVVVELVPVKGWHIYWLNPGDSGLATSIELKQNERSLTSRVRMPVPKRKVSAGDIVSFAFDGPTRFFVAAEALRTTASVTVTAGWLACADVCIKGSKTLELSALDADPKKSAVSVITTQRQDWAALPIERTLNWNKRQQQLVFEAPVGAQVTLYPHKELFRRLDGHDAPYCHNNQCQLPAAVVAEQEPSTQLLATVQIKTSTSSKAYQTDILKGYTP